MTTARTFILNGHAVRMRAVDAVLKAPEGVACVVRPARRGSAQNALVHAMFADIARQVDFFGARRDAQTVKRLLVDAFARVKEAMGEPITGHGYTLPSLDGRGAVQLGVQTRRFSKALMSELIDYLYSWGADFEVRWTANVDVPEWARDREDAHA